MKNRVILSLVTVAAASSFAFAEELPTLPNPESKSKVIVNNESEGVSMAYLGVGSKEVPKSLLKHIKTPTNKGVQVIMVAPNSTAFKAGIKVGDIIYSMNGKAIDCRDCLSEMIKSLSPGDEITLGLMKGGVAQQIQVTLGEAPVFQPLVENTDSEPTVHSAEDSSMPSLENLLSDDSFFTLIAPDAQQSMQDLKKDLRNMDQGSESLFLQLLEQTGKRPSITVPVDTDSFFSASSMETKMVVTGDLSITVQSTNDDKVLIVKDRKGKLIYEGPYNNDEDKAAIPKNIKKKLKALKL